MNQIFYSTDERYTVRHLTGQVRSVIAQRTFCPLHIRYIFVLSVIHPLLIRQSPLVDSSLLHMPYSCILCAPYTFREDPHSHRNDLQNLSIFAFFLSVWRLLPLSVIWDSTISGNTLIMNVNYFAIAKTLHLLW